MDLNYLLEKVIIEGRVTIKDADTCDILFATSDWTFGECLKDEDVLSREIVYMYSIDHVGMTIEVRKED